MAEPLSDIDAIALLDEPSRRALYEWVVAQDDAVSRDAAAAGVGVSRSLAAFHLDRLVNAELLAPEYRRLSGRTGPGAGRPAKLYRRGSREFAVSLPRRDYQSAARLMAASMHAIGHGELPDELRASAHEAGLAVGVETRRKAGTRPGRRRLHDALLTTLGDRGYEPRDVETDEIRLGNCPFHALVEDHRDIVCGMNLALAEGILVGMRHDGFSARLDPRPDQCCVAIRTKPAP